MTPAKKRPPPVYPKYPGTDADPIARARTWLRGQTRTGGAHCPVCTQLTKIYARTINHQMAHALIRLYRATAATAPVYGHWPTIMQRKQADEAKLVHWGLIEPMPGEREDGSVRTGWWRVTEKGRDWLYERITVPKTVDLFDSRMLGQPYGEPWTVRQALSTYFDYDELMSS